MIAEKTGTAEGHIAARRAYQKPSLTEHGSLAVRTAGQPGLLLDAIIQIAQPS
ncbi:lasso RiPP family leader peptide-containing protein [Pseudofrankia inefficax]|uniref:Uncharacterized protein n=1 Tax=Pseudofrankia inefficax (strain DSM 45817 / CECT 9037 / DDB 130130 / EuI1c) TaxID=298654 RepID=E3IWV1_PSEI1|nr:lasso RiPP family leader peptide-containing protein [Pseudofrankia inefficax]ADP82575.1 hypothetical protein FraEuI1c_4582 [Pseudofrankia inefficax]